MLESDLSNNDLGIPYIVMSKAQGSLLQHTWDNSEKDVPEMSHEQKAKVIIQLGAMTWQLSRLGFNQAGSLFEESRDFQIKTCLSRGLILDERHTLEDVPRGPFSSEKAYYDAQISAFIQHAKYLPLGPHCFFAPIPAQSEYDDHAAFKKAADWWNDFVAV